MLRSFQSPRLRSSTRKRTRRQSAVLGIEPLERRALFSIFTVQNLADSGEGSLRQAVLDANTLTGADEIKFDHKLSGTIALTSGQLTISDDLVIHGPSADEITVSGSDISRVFAIQSSGATVNIKGLTISNGRIIASSADGGGILNAGAVLSLDHVVMSDNTAMNISASVSQARGGAVANVAGGTLTITNSLFTGNRVVGAPFSGIVSGGAVFNASSRMTISHSTFEGNRGLGGEGGGQVQGGAILSTANSIATITDSTFLENVAIAGNGSGGSTGFARGGAIVNFASTLTIDNSNLIDNVVQGGSNITGFAPRVGFASAGGLFSADGATLFMNGCTVMGNLVQGGSNNTCLGGNGFVGNAQGGGMTNVGKATMTNCRFENNESRGGDDNSGGGIGHQLVGTGSGGGIATTAGDPTGQPTRLTLDNVTIRDNRAVGGNGNTGGAIAGAGIGGGLSVNGSNNNLPTSFGAVATVRNSTLARNIAIGGAAGDALGGGLANQLGGVLLVSASTFDHNLAQAGVGGDGLGGAIYNDPASTHSSNLGAPTVLTLELSTIKFNEADGATGIGGGVYNLGLLNLDEFTVIDKNEATTSDDDLFSI